MMNSAHLPLYPTMSSLFSHLNLRSLPSALIAPRTFFHEKDPQEISEIRNATNITPTQSIAPNAQVDITTFISEIDPNLSFSILRDDK